MTCTISESTCTLINCGPLVTTCALVWQLVVEILWQKSEIQMLNTKPLASEVTLPDTLKAQTLKAGLIFSILVRLKQSSWKRPQT